MLIRLDQRPEASKIMVYVSPLIAVVLTILTAMIMFGALGVDPAKAIETFFIEPVSTLDGVAELLVKATPLVLIGVGLSPWLPGERLEHRRGRAIGDRCVGGRRVGASVLRPVEHLSGSRHAGLRRYRRDGLAAIPAWLKTRFNTNEILTSLMLTYVGLLVLSYLVHGPWKDPEGQNFPESRLFHDSALLPILIDETRLNVGWLLALFVVVLGWILMSRHIIGFQIKVIGMAPMAGAFAGFKENRLIWITLLISVVVVLRA